MLHSAQKFARFVGAENQSTRPALAWAPLRLLHRIDETILHPERPVEERPQTPPSRVSPGLARERAEILRRNLRRYVHRPLLAVDCCKLAKHPSHPLQGN